MTEQPAQLLAIVSRSKSSSHGKSAGLTALPRSSGGRAALPREVREGARDA
jgi:hypothetical protein